jgi:hypothetical protein
MNVLHACKILDLEKDYDIVDIKRQYRLKALQYHPDKNKAENAAAMFQEIHSAYHYLINDLDDDDDEDDDIDDEYQSYLFSFLKGIFTGEIQNEKKNIFMILFKRILTVCEENAIKIIDNIDRKTLLKIYEIIDIYRDVLHCTSDFIEKLKEKISSKINADEYIILNPTLNDLLENRLYKLSINGYQYVVPLWHHELVYDNSGCEVIVRCLPVLEENIEIDEENNIHIKKVFQIDELWEKEKIEIMVGENLELIVNTRLLKLAKEQIVMFSNQGISKINSTEIYDIQQKGNIYIHLGIILDQR